jgi:predicted MPP superfamily phosphohydrolase
MIFLYSGIALIFIALAYMRFETTMLRTKKVYLTKSSTHLKVIQISDIHIKFLKVNITKITRVLEEENPDMIILTGDYIDNVKQIPEFLNFLEKVRGTHKVFLCFGNHDYKAFHRNEVGLVQFISDMEKMGINVLLNDSMYYEKGSNTYNIIGIEDLRSNRHQVEKAFEHCRNNVTSNIAFSHNPDIALELPEGKVDFLLCGHFHGGQIWMPFNFEFKFLRHEKLGKIGIKRGLKRFNNITIYISRGIGNVLFPLRFLSPPEITVLYFP